MKRAHTVFAGALLAACSGAPATPGPAPTPTAPPPAGRRELPRPQPEAPPPNQAPPTAGTPRTSRLENGLSVVLTTVPPGHDAILQFGLQAGVATQAPGLAELTMHALLTSADSSRGRPSLAATIGSLGGTAQVHAGLTTTWLELRVPGALWQRALQALREALDVPQQSRHQLDRVRDDLIAATAAAVTADPLATMAQQLLLGSASTAMHTNELIDRDAGEVGVFQARALRPELSVLVIEAPETTDRLLTTMQRQPDGMLSWKPATAASGAMPTLARPFRPGVHWAPDGTDGPCRVALVTVLPDLAHGDAAAAFLLHACITLDGIGGRLEQLQRERGLGAIRWRSEIVQTPETVALVLRTEATAADAAALWQTWLLAQRSLSDVPPTPEERNLARRRAPLSARLSLLDAGARARTTARLLPSSPPLARLDQAFASLAASDAGELAAATTYYLSLPSALIVLGGDPPPDLEGAQRFTPLPSMLAPHATGPIATSPDAETAGAAPWLARAVEAVGGKDRLLRLHGWRCDAAAGNERAPHISESIAWDDDGTLIRTREVLGQTITTTLRGLDWSEQLGTKVAALAPREAKLLRDQQQRHPLALLAAHVRGELTFRIVSQRNVGDRDLMVLEVVGDRQREDRLRLHLDAESCLVRAVEVWETLADGEVVHVHDAWSDYRSTQGLRAPFHRLSTQDDGQNRIETVFARWAPRLR